jgi:hypothetical protein
MTLKNYTGGRCVMKKNIVKIVLDVIMAILLLLMYSKNAISMSFHEVGGLAVCGLFLIHKGLNWKWIVGVSKRLFDKSLPAKTRLGYIVDFLLLVAMTFIAVSGIMISKTLFISVARGGGFWKMGHYFSSAAAIILVGIHIGLHWSFIRNMFAKVLKLPRAVAKPLAIICLAAVLTYGGYNTITSNFIRWLTSPFTTSAIAAGGMQQKGERPEGMLQKGERPQGFGERHGNGVGRPDGPSSFSPARALGVVGTYGSITSIFAALTLLVEKVLKRKKQPVLSKV